MRRVATILRGVNDHLRLATNALNLEDPKGAVHGNPRQGIGLLPPHRRQGHGGDLGIDLSQGYYQVEVPIKGHVHVMLLPSPIPPLYFMDPEPEVEEGFVIER